MASITGAMAWGVRARGGLRTSRWDGVMVALALAQGVVMAGFASAPAIALGLWWNSNTIAHNFLHRPFFRQRAANVLFGLYLSALLGVPQALWRGRHLAHHAGVRWRLRISGELGLQTALVLAGWSAMAWRAPRFWLTVYLPGYVAGLGLCALHGYYEHARGVTSHYGRFYNVLFFNDGYHAEHHANPAVHWSRLRERIEPGARSSRWPAPLRWMEVFGLEPLERLVLRAPWLQGFVLRNHANAFRELLGGLPQVGRVAIVGGGVWPRTALIVRELLPAAKIAIIDANRGNLEEAREWLKDDRVEFVHAIYRAGDEVAADLVVIPLSFRGDREALYARAVGPPVMVHDWMWRRRGASCMVSIWLLKRVNLIGMAYSRTKAGDMLGDAGCS